MNFPLLQAQYEFFPAQDSRTILISGIAAAGFILLLLLGSFYSSRTSGRKRTKGRFSFTRKARSIGLDREQAHMLFFLAARAGLPHPEHLFENQTLLESLMRRAYVSINRSSMPESEKEKRKGNLLRIRQIIDASMERRFRFSDSRELKLNQEVQLLLPGGERITTVMNRNRKDFLGLEIPRSTRGAEIRWSKGTPLTVLLSRTGSDIHSFPSEVIGYGRGRSSSSLLLKHSTRIRHEQKRRHRRKDISVPVYFTPVLIVEAGTGRNRRREAMVDTKRRALGTMLDISAGGCAVKTPTPLRKGQLLRMEFDPGNRTTVTVLGKVQHLRAFRGRTAVMHIMFTKLSRQTINRIQEYVYDVFSDAE